MTKQETTHFREQLRKLAKRIQGTTASAEGLARMPTGGDAVGDLSGTPMHLGDAGSEAFTQELGATLLENEQYLQGEIIAALERIQRETYGMCENCGQNIGEERLEALPYTRYCVACSAALRDGREVNVNDGRPRSWTDGIGLRAEGPPEGVPGGPAEMPANSDRHAAGTPGGGTAVGGLAGSNIGNGEPEEDELEDAMGSGDFDAKNETDRVEEEFAEDEPVGGFAGHSGGAVGGTPANKRASAERTD